jgi:hypothetical protein
MPFRHYQFVSAVSMLNFFKAQHNVPKHLRIVANNYIACIIFLPATPLVEEHYENFSIFPSRLWCNIFFCSHRTSTYERLFMIIIGGRLSLRLCLIPLFLSVFSLLTLYTFRIPPLHSTQELIFEMKTLCHHDIMY